MTHLITQYRGLKRESYVLFFGRLVTAMGSFVWPMLTFFLTTRLGMTDGDATLLIAAATLLSLPAAILGGKLADRFSRKRIIIVFDVATFVFYGLAAILPISFLTAALIFCAGLFQTIESPAYDALVADFSTSAQRDRAYSLSYLGFNLGYIVGASVSGVLFENHLALAFFLNGSAILFSTLLIALFVHPKNAVTHEAEDDPAVLGEYEQPMAQSVSVLQVLRARPAVAIMMLVGCLASLPSSVTGVLLPLQLKGDMGAYGATIYGYLNSLNGLVVILFTPVLTFLLRRYTEIPKATAGLLLFIAGITLFAFDPPVPLLFAGMFVFTLGEVVTVLGVNPYRSRRIPVSHRGRIGGISSVIGTLFHALTQFLISFILTASNSNYRLVWTIFTLCALAGAVLYVLLYRLDRHSFPRLYEGDIRL